MILLYFNLSLLFIYISSFFLIRKHIRKTIIKHNILYNQIKVMSNVWNIKTHYSYLNDNDRKNIAFLANQMKYNPDYTFIASKKTIKKWYWQFFNSIDRSTPGRGRPGIPDIVKSYVWDFRKKYGFGYRRIVGEIKKLGYKLSKSSIPYILRTFKPNPPGKRFSLLKIANIIGIDFKVINDNLGKKLYTLFLYLDVI